MKRNGKWVCAVGAATLLCIMSATSAGEFFSPNGNRVNSIYGGTLTPRQANSYSGELYPDIMGTSISTQREFRRALPSIYSYSQTAHHQNRAETKNLRDIINSRSSKKDTSSIKRKPVRGAAYASSILEVVDEGVVEEEVIEEVVDEDTIIVSDSDGDAYFTDDSGNYVSLRQYLENGGTITEISSLAGASEGPTGTIISEEMLTEDGIVISEVEDGEGGIIISEVMDEDGEYVIAEEGTIVPGERVIACFGDNGACEQEACTECEEVVAAIEDEECEDSFEAVIATLDPAAATVYCPTSMCSPGSKWVMWDVPFAVKEKKKQKDGHLGYNQSVSGFATGISYMLGESSAVGVAVGYDYSKMEGRDNYYMKNRADTFHAAIYGGTNMGSLFLDGYAGISRSWHRTERGAFTTGGIDQFDRNSGNFNDTVLSAGLKASYVYILSNDTRITPSIGLDYSHVRFSGLTEKGRNTAGGTSTTLMNVRKTTYGNAAVPMMVSINRTFATGKMTFGGDRTLWTPEVRVGYVPQLGAKRASTRNTFVSGANTGQTFRNTSTTLADSYATAGVGMKIKIRDRFIFALDYDVAIASKYQNHSLTAMYGVSF